MMSFFEYIAWVNFMGEFVMKLFSDGGMWLILWEANMELFQKKKT
jgi:hypothetical protein